MKIRNDIERMVYDTLVDTTVYTFEQFLLLSINGYFFENERKLINEIIKYTEIQHKLPINRDVSFGFGYQLCLQELKQKLQSLLK